MTFSNLNFILQTLRISNKLVDGHHKHVYLINLHLLLITLSLAKKTYFKWTNL